MLRTCALPIGVYRHELVITRRGKPVARVVPAEPPRSLVGSVEFLVSDDELIAPLHEEWEPTFEE